MIDMRKEVLDLKCQGVSAPDAGKRMTDNLKTRYPEWAAHKERDNIGGMPGFVERLYDGPKLGASR